MYMFDTIEECCTQFYPFEYASCIDPNSNTDANQSDPCADDGDGDRDPNFPGWDQTSESGGYYVDW